MADTSRGQMAYIPEVTLGVTPVNPALQIVRMTGTTLAHTKNTVQSSELDATRMLTDIPEVSAESSGELNFEYSAASYDAFIEAALGGTRSIAVSVAAGSADIVAATGVVTATGAFENAEAGQWLLFTGWDNAGNNGWKKIGTVDSDNEVTLAHTAGLVNETDGGAIRGRTIKNGIVVRSFSLEQGFTDLNIWRLFRGQRVSSMALNIAAGEILTGSFGFMGLSNTMEGPGVPTWLGTGSRAAVNTNALLNATANIGQIYIDGAPTTACFKSLSFSLDNGVRSVRCVGSKYPSQVSLGRQTVTGSITKLFADRVLYDKMMNHDDVSIALGGYNTAGGIHIEMPRVKLGSDNVSLSGGVDSDVDEQIEWSAIKYEDAALSQFYQVRVDIAG